MRVLWETLETFWRLWGLSGDFWDFWKTSYFWDYLVMWRACGQGFSKILINRFGIYLRICWDFGETSRDFFRDLLRYFRVCWDFRETFRDFLRDLLEDFFCNFFDAFLKLCLAFIGDFSRDFWETLGTFMRFLKL